MSIQDREGILGNVNSKDTGMGKEIIHVNSNGGGSGKGETMRYSSDLIKGKICLGNKLCRMDCWGTSRGEPGEGIWISCGGH